MRAGGETQSFNPVGWGSGRTRDPGPPKRSRSLLRVPICLFRGTPLPRSRYKVNVLPMECVSDRLECQNSREHHLRGRVGDE